MGEGIIRFWNSKVKREHKIAFLSAFVIALLVHLYKFTNTLPGHDSVFNYYTNQNVLGLGRWALSAACGISSFYDLPWIIGIISCVFIALTAVVIVELFRIKNPVVIVLAGAVLAVSPATTETFFFGFTADGYMAAMLLAALAVYFSRIEEKRISRHIVSGVCVCISCGIYQAYVSFALILAVCCFVMVLLENSHSRKECFKWVLRQAVIYIAALAAYYIIWKLCMRFSGMQAKDYLGVSEVGTISADLLLHGAVKSVRTSILYFLQWNFFEYGLTLYNALSIIFIILFAAGIVIAVVKSGIYKRNWALIMFVLCFLAICPFAGMWHFTSDQLSYPARMLQSLGLLYILAALVYERWCKLPAKNFLCIFLTVVMWNNAVIANICYFHMNECYERSYAEGVEMMREIRELDEQYDFDKIAVVGIRTEGVGFDHHDPATGKVTKYGEIYHLSSNMERTILSNAYQVVLFLEETFGLSLDMIAPEYVNEHFNTEEVKSMNCWPDNGSITVIDDVCVIKLSDIEE